MVSSDKKKILMFTDRSFLEKNKVQIRASIGKGCFFIKDSDGDNRETYGKCNNPEGHGHLYRVEGTISGDLDERTGALFPLDQLQQTFDDALASWDYKHLDLDTDDFRKMPSTGENIIQVLWPRLDERLEGRLHFPFISGGSGFWCGLPGGCAITVGGELMVQATLNAGVIFAF